MASRILIDKGVKEFCRAAKKVNSNKKFQANFYLAGPLDLESPGALSHEQIVELCESNHVSFLGNRADLPKVLSQTDIFVLPSFYAEGIPKVLLEAAASGCAIITTDHPGCRDAVLNEVTGLTVKPKDELSLVAGIIRLLSDRNLIVSMGIAGRKLATEKFSIEKVVDTHYNIYAELKNHKK